jgi:hypothetical protein
MRLTPRWENILRLFVATKRSRVEIPYARNVVSLID